MLPSDYNARKNLPLYSFTTGYFPDALIELVKVAVAGNIQHNPGEPLHWARGKSMDQLNTAMRHLFDHGMGCVYDEEDAKPEVLEAIGTSPPMHLAKAAWRLLAEIQLLCEARARGEDITHPTWTQGTHRVLAEAADALAGAPTLEDFQLYPCPVPPKVVAPGRLELACGCFGSCKGGHAWPPLACGSYTPSKYVLDHCDVCSLKAADHAAPVVPPGTDPRI